MAPEPRPELRERNAHVEVRDVTQVYDGLDGGTSLAALGPISFDVRRGEFFTVVGPSGCGKTTLLEILAGLRAPTSGTVRFEDKPVAGKVPDGLGVVFQEDASFPWLTVEDNIVFGLRRRGATAGEIADKLKYALNLMGLGKFRKSFPAQLSGGMRQRVCIAQTLVLQPRLILLDEPFGALDAQTRVLLGEELLKLWNATGATVVLITHALDEAAMLSDRIGAMSARPGRFVDIVETGWPRDRDSTILGTQQFAEITARLWTSVRSESLKALSST